MNKLKKFINEAMRPEIPFEEWALINGVNLENDKIKDKTINSRDRKNQEKFCKKN